MSTERKPLSDTNPCEQFETPSRAHHATAFRSRVMLAADYRNSGNDASCYHNAELWMSASEAESVARVLLDAVACVRANQQTPKETEQ